MARTQLTVQSISSSGWNLTDNKEAANADGEYIANPTGDTMFYFENGSGGAITVTIQTPQTLAGGVVTVDEKEISVANGKAYIFGGLFKETFNQTDSTVYIDFSGVGSCFVAAWKTSRR